MRKICFSLIIAMIAGVAWGIPANNQYVMKQMADGSNVMVRLAGDEFFSYLVTNDGRVVKDIEGVMIETGMMESDMTRSYVARQRAKSKLKQMPAKTNGSVTKGLVILVNFSEKSFTYSRTEFYNKLNQTGYSTNGATGSAKDYFVDNSANTYTPAFDVYGPYTLDNRTSYYGAHDGSENDIRPAQMVLDAVRKLAADTSAHVNFADYDSDHNGAIDNVFIFYAGCGENISGNNSNLIWPHAWYVSTGNTDAANSSDLTFGGKRLNGYACTSELSGPEDNPRLCGIGTFCHEFSHVLGLADLYVTDYSSDHKTMGQWDLMCNGSYLNNELTPAGYSIFERFAVGWYNPPVISATDTYELDYTLRGNEGYIITSTGNFNHNFENPNPSEYYVIENRQNVKWDAYLPGHGMVATKIKWDLDRWNYNYPVNDPNDMVVDMIEAGGPLTELGDPSDSYPGSMGITSLNTYPDYNITNITEINQKIIFDIDGGAPKGPFTVAFDSRGMGVADTASIKEQSIFQGVVLPDVSADSGYQFVGWTTSMTGNDTVIYTAGTTYNPKRNTVLFAAYTQNGNIVEDYYGDCMAEHFRKLGNSLGQNITTTINSYADIKGWSGNLLEANHGMVKVGDDNVKGYLVTPEIPLQGTVEVAFIVAQTSRSYFGVITEDNHASDYVLVTSEPGVARVTLYDVRPDSKIRFVSDVNTFEIGDIHFCGDEAPTSVVNPEADNDGPVVLRSKVIGGHVRIEGLRDGMSVMVVDGMGRILMTRDAEGDTMEFEAPETVYFIKIL